MRRQPCLASFFGLKRGCMWGLGGRGLVATVTQQSQRICAPDCGRVEKRTEDASHMQNEHATCSAMAAPAATEN